MRNDRKASARNKGSAKSTISGPRTTPRGAGNGPAERKMEGTQELAAAFPFNASKPGEIGAAARTPKTGVTAEPPDPAVVGSTLTEANASPKTGAPARQGLNPGNQPLDRVRVASRGESLDAPFC